MSSVVEELLARLAISVLVFVVIWGGSHIIGHPLAWWLVAFAALVVVFLGEWILDAVD